MRTKITLFTMMLAIFSIGLFAQPEVLNKRGKIHSKFQKENNFQMFRESYPLQEKGIPSLLNQRKQDQLKKDQLIQSERNVLPDFLKKKEGPLFIFSSRENKQNFTSKNFLQKAKNIFNTKAEIKQRLDSVVTVERDTTTNEWLNSEKYEYAYDERGNRILEARYHWDSITEQWKGYKYEYAYDISGNLILEAYYSWNSVTEQWESFKSEYAYDERENLILERRYHWNSDIEQWEVFWKLEYTYDESGDLILEARYNWDSNAEQWEGYKYEYAYDERGNCILEIDYHWDSNTEQWKGNWKFEFAYDESGNLILEVEYDWDSNTEQWEVFWKLENTYDESGNLILEAGYNWDSNTEQWKGNWKFEFAYDKSGNRILFAYYHWNSNTEQWEIFWKLEYTYDESGNLILEAGYNWESNTEQWERAYKYEYAYDERGNRILEVDYIWNNINQQWQPTDKYAYTYDYNYSIESLLFPFFGYKNKVVNAITYKSSDGVNWTESGKEIYYYSDIEMAVPQIPMGSINLYPNPVVNDLNIVLPDDISQAEFKLFDLQGRMLVTKNIVADKKVNLEKLAAGVYLYQIITEKETCQGKLVK